MITRSLIVLPEFLALAEMLPKETRSKLVRILKLLSVDVRHSSLQCKKVNGTKNSVYECRVDRNVRLIYDVVSEGLRCWYVGEHDVALNFARFNVDKGIPVDDVELKEIPESLVLIRLYLFQFEEPKNFEKIDISVFERMED